MHMRHYRQLTQEARYQITALKGLGYTQRQIARETDRSPSTISWELRRELFRVIMKVFCRPSRILVIVCHNYCP
ncbi:helix-turn-helix domain-containing protein [Thiolapillus sp.]|uniref:helix-turn-helix domain-containing protein n=2 Tax=Thiolapillus sp. TaxID=2017437 RepID=UPI003AF9EB3F